MALPHHRRWHELSRERAALDFGRIQQTSRANTAPVASILATGRHVVMAPLTGGFGWCTNKGAITLIALAFFGVVGARSGVGMRPKPAVCAYQATPTRDS